ncbi:MAG: hypothetical protein H6739_18750 [Alphaproteobacteria bacterium]|nr:hypothetical protein [Alphaproteobacteria bacterium]
MSTRPALFGLAVLALGAGCNPTTTYSGYDMVDAFPVDGERAWVFVNDAKPYDLRVEMSSAADRVGEVDVHTFEFYDNDLGDLLMTMRWSSDTIHGVLLHGYETVAEEPTGQGGDDTGGDDTGDTGDGARGPLEAVTYDPPIQFVDRKMIVGESVETETGGATWTSTFLAQEDCPNHLLSGDLAPSCYKIGLDDGDGDPMVGQKPAGTWWIATRYTLIYFQLSGDSDKWVLADYDWSPAE